MAKWPSTTQSTLRARKLNWATSRPRPRSKPGEMNKTEARYAREVLDPMMLAGEILAYRFEPMKLRLAKNTFYTFDFLVVLPGWIEIHEVKGHWEDDARVKWKTAAEQFPWFRFVAVQYKKKQWVTEYYD